MTKPPPVACCLSAGEYQGRIAWLEKLARNSLREYTPRRSVAPPLLCAGSDRGSVANG